MSHPEPTFWNVVKFLMTIIGSATVVMLAVVMIVELTGIIYSHSTKPITQAVTEEAGLTDHTVDYVGNSVGIAHTFIITKQGQDFVVVATNFGVAISPLNKEPTNAEPDSTDRVRLSAD